MRFKAKRNQDGRGDSGLAYGFVGYGSIESLYYTDIGARRLKGVLSLSVVEYDIEYCIIQWQGVARGPAEGR